MLHTGVGWLFLLDLFSLSFFQPSIAPIVIPPWYTLQKKIANTFGCDPAVTVCYLETSNDGRLHTLPIVVDDRNKGTALRTIIRANFPMGNTNVATVVKNSKGELWKAIHVASGKQLQTVITAAFRRNPLFVESKPRFCSHLLFRFHGDCVGLIMKKEVVQFPNDDISEFYGNFNGVAAQVVSDLIVRSYVNDTVWIIMGTETKQSCNDRESTDMSSFV